MTIDSLCNQYAAWIMHKNNMDVCYEIISAYDDGASVILAFNIINLGYTGRPYTISHGVKASISYKEVLNFTELNYNQVITLRTKPGMPA